MKIVVDANIFVSAILKDSLTRRLLKYPFFEFYTVDFVRSEFEEHMGEFCKRSGLSREEMMMLINGLLKNVRVISTYDYKHKLDHAKRLISDIDDVPYLALALALGTGAVIWSNDAALKQQSSARVISTSELIGMLKTE